MKTQELRIGNVVFDGLRPCVITGLMLTEDNFLIRTKSSEGESDNQEITPIELNLQWLRGFGFISGSEQENRFVHPTRLVVEQEAENFFFGMEGQSFKIPIRSLHQLQNLFYDFTGKELQMVKAEA